MQMGQYKKVKLLIDGHEPLILETALIGGRVSSKENTAVYCGYREIEDLGVALLQSMRAAIRVATDELEVSKDNVIEFLTFTLITALKMEEENEKKPKTKSALDKFIAEQFLKMTKDNL